MSTLYRDYRPQKFSDVLGQNHLKITLQNEVSVGRPASAYLFCGPRAVGKTTLARIMAKAVNCENRKETESEPCNNCPNCLSITSGRNLDVIEIDAASNTGVDNVRDNIIAFSRLAPAQAKFKVFIIDEVHMLSVSAFNALLKIIEEPPSYVIFILCTTEIQKVPGTVISRCERYDFKRISVKEVVKKLNFIADQEKIKIDNEVLEAVARRSGGHLRDAESLLGQIFSLGDKEITKEQAELIIPSYNSNEAINLLDFLSRKDAAKAVALINSLIDTGVNIKIFTNEIISLLRKIMLDKLSPELINNLGLDLGDSLEKRLSQVGADLSWDQIFSFTRRFLEAGSDNRSPLIPQLPLELAVTELCLSSQPPKIIAASVSKQIEPLKKELKPEISGTNTITKPDEQLTKTVVFDKNISSLSAAEIKLKWPEVLVKVKKQNHSLSFVLQSCEPRGISENKLCLAFKYKFHQDRINDPAIKKIVEATFQEVFEANLSLETLIDESLNLSQETHETKNNLDNLIAPSDNSESKSILPNPESNNLMTDLLKTFGGEVVT